MHEWQNWDIPGVAKAIEEFWLSNGRESTHRDELVDLVLQNLPEGHATVLEVGCGTGLIYQRIVSRAAASVRYIGVDISRDMLAIARHKFPEATLLRGDGYRLAFKDKAFDVVLCFEVLGHLPRIDTFVRELQRVARRTCIMTIWRSDTNDVVEGQEQVNGTPFLHRSYSDAYMRSAIQSADLPNAHDIRTSSLKSGGRAFVVHIGNGT